MCMYSFMSSLAITHKELVCQCCVCSFCALYTRSNEWRWLDYSVSVRLLGGLQRSSYRVSLIWLSESIWALSFVRVMVGSCVTTALLYRLFIPLDRAVLMMIGSLLFWWVGEWVGATCRGQNAWHWGFSFCLWPCFVILRLLTSVARSLWISEMVKVIINYYLQFWWWQDSIKENKGGHLRIRSTLNCISIILLPSRCWIYVWYWCRQSQHLKPVHESEYFGQFFFLNQRNSCFCFSIKFKLEQMRKKWS